MAEQHNGSLHGASSTTTTTTTVHAPTTTTTTSHSSGGPRTSTYTTSNGQQYASHGDGSYSTTIEHPIVTTTHQLPVYPVSPVYHAPSASIATQTPSIRIRRHGSDHSTQTGGDDASHRARRRAPSEPPQPPQPQRPQAALLPQDDLEIRRQVTATPLQTVHEEGSGAATPDFLAASTASATVAPPAVPLRSPRRPAWMRQLSSVSVRARDQTVVTDAPEYDYQVVDMLDCIDPEVATLTTLNNVQNSLFIPNLGTWYRRQPTYDLSQPSPVTPPDEESGHAQTSVDYEKQTETTETEGRARRPGAPRMDTISSVLTGMSEGHNYAVLPHGASLPGWTPEEKAALNDHVRHLLFSKRAKFRRGLRGFGRYVRKPVGFLVSLYAFLLTFWGAAWVLFLIGWISVGGRQAYFIEICDQILTALFCVVGIGFAPWRAVDTYHMIYVAHYAHLTWRLRKERGLPDLKDHNELPSRPDTHAWEKGEEVDPDSEEIVLNPNQQQKLEHHQQKLANSHSFYKPHETSTHKAFSLRLLIAIVVLLDCHSLFQMALGGTTWGIYYKDRPKVLTAVILTCSISCNITAGIIISIGDRRSRKKLVVEQMFRQGLTEEALETLRKERGLKASGLGRQGSRRSRSNK